MDRTTNASGFVASIRHRRSGRTVVQATVAVLGANHVCVNVPAVRCHCYLILSIGRRGDVPKARSINLHDACMYTDSVCPSLMN
jgi:hypothetical protein